MVAAFVAVTVISTSTVDNSAIKRNVPIPTGM